MDCSLHIAHDERDLLQACKQGEEWAQRAIYEEYFSPMMNVLVRYTRSTDTARDLVHDGFIKVFRNIGSYKAGSSLHAWIKRIMINTAIDNIRKENKRRTDDIDEQHDVASMDVSVISRLSEQELLRLVQSLSPSYRAVFNLFVIEGYSHREISEVLGCTESTCRSNLVKARRILQSMVSKHLSS